MYNSTNYMMINANVDRSDYFEANYRNTMSFKGMLSPASSSMDSIDMKMNSPPPPIYENNDIFMEPTITGEAFLSLVEKPVEKFRFRYKSEMSGTHGSLTGASSDKIRRNTFPTVHLNNYDAPAVVRCSIYQIKSDMPHAHRLIIKTGSGEKDDPHEADVSRERGYTAIFQGMGIIHTAKKNLLDELARKKTRLVREDLYRKGYFRDLTHNEKAEILRIAEQESRNINLNMVRLKFEAFRKDVINGNTILMPLCDPIFTEGIKNLKSALTGELKIVRMDHVTTSCLGGQEIYILVEKVTKNNIKVRFFECDDEDREIWHDYGSFSQNDVHHQYAIVFKAPPYRDQNIENSVDVLIELVRPSDGARSESREFRYKPCDRPGKKKRVRCSDDSLPSSEIPTTIKGVSFGSTPSFSNSMLPDDPGFFTDIQNMGSNEFDKIFKALGKDYAITLQTSPDIIKEDGMMCRPGSTSNEIEESKLAPKVVNQLTAFLKTKPNTAHAEQAIKKLFGTISTPKENNALHTAILHEQHEYLQYFLVLLSKMKHLKILDLKNADRETALHLAVKRNNPMITQLLITVGSDANFTDNKGNTALHLANNYNLLDYSSLIKVTDLKIRNDDGYTVLHAAILAGNLKNVKILVKADADVNLKDRLSNNTGLHLAIIEKQKEIVEFLLEESNANLELENYNKQTSLSLAKLYESESDISKEIFEVVQNFAMKNGLQVFIKTEHDSDSDDNLVIKSEPNSPEGMEFEIDEDEYLFLKNHTFTPECARALHTVLHNTEFLEKLKSDLEFESISPVSPRSSVTQVLLNYANVSQKTVFDIRKLLISYGATAAVDIINKFYGM